MATHPVAHARAVRQTTPGNGARHMPVIAMHNKSPRFRALSPRCYLQPPWMDRDSPQAGSCRPLAHSHDSSTAVRHCVRRARQIIFSTAQLIHSSVTSTSANPPPLRPGVPRERCGGPAGLCRRAHHRNAQRSPPPHRNARRSPPATPSARPPATARVPWDAASTWATCSMRRAKATGARSSERALHRHGRGKVQHGSAPVRWSNHAAPTADAKLDEAFAPRVDWAVDALLARGVHVILDMHHYSQIFGDKPHNRGIHRRPVGRDRAW